MVILDSYSARRVQGKQSSLVSLSVENHFFLVSFKLGTCINLGKNLVFSLEFSDACFSHYPGVSLFGKKILSLQLPQHVNLYAFHGHHSVA